MTASGQSRRFCDGPAANRWGRRAPLPTARSGIAAAILDERVVIVGGEAPIGTHNEVEAYDPKTNDWRASTNANGAPRAGSRKLGRQDVRHCRRAAPLRRWTRSWCR